MKESKLCFLHTISLLPFYLFNPPGKGYQTIFKVHSYVLLTFMSSPWQWHRSIPESHQCRLFSSTVTHHPKYVNCLSFKCPRNICCSSRCPGGQTAAALPVRSWWVSPAEQGWWSSLPRAACVEVFLGKGTAEGCHTCRTVTLQVILICDAFCHLCVQYWKPMVRYFKSHKQLCQVRKEIREELEGNSWVVAFIPYSFLGQMHAKVHRNSKPRVVRIIHSFLDQVDMPLR